MAVNQKKLDKIVEELEDTHNTYLLRSNNYKDIQNVLETTETVPVEMLDKILGICVRDIKNDKVYSASALILIPKLIEKIKVLPDESSLPSLIPSALAVLYILKLGANVEVDALLMLSIECLKKYPKSVIISLIEDHVDDIYEVIMPHTMLKMSNNNTSLKFMEVLPYKLIMIILKSLPQIHKANFVKHGFKVWFQGVIPKLFAISLVKDDDLEECFEAVETLTDILILHDYTNNVYWKSLLEKCISVEENFPALIKRLLQTGKKYWYRLFIILIKLLKNEITTPIQSSKIPIKSLLPVVELAFKMQTDIRYQAFLCWDALIDNFSSDLDESQLYRRMKLLIIPLKSSNTKVEKTTVAKFNTWWRLIRMYCSKMDKFVDMVLLPFLQFCFGKVVNDKYVPSSGHFNDDIRKLCVQALVEIAGHFQCEGCCQIPKLHGRLMSTKMLVDYWNNWLHYIKTAVLIISTCNSETGEQQIKCLWKSLLSTIAEMPDNNVRRDLVKTLMDLPTVLLNDNTDAAVAVIVSNTLIFSLFDEEEKFYDLLKSNKQKEDGPLDKILFTLAQPKLTEYLQSTETKDVLIKLKPLAHFVLNTKYNIPDDVLERLCKGLCPNTTSMLLWISLADAISESNYKLRENTFDSFLLWPVEFLRLLPDEITSTAWSQWATLYNSVVPIQKRRLNINIKSLLLKNYKLMDSSKNFALCVALTILKYSLSDNYCTDIMEEVDLTREIIKKSEPQHVMKIFPLLNDTLVLLLNIGSKSDMTEPGLKILPVVLELFIPILKDQNNEQNKVVHFLDYLLKELDSLLKPNVPTTYLPQIITQLLECLPLVNKKSSLAETIKAVCSKCLLNKYPLDMLLPKIKEVVFSDVYKDEVICVATDSDNIVKEIANSKSTCDKTDTTFITETEREKQTSEIKDQLNNFTTPNSKRSTRKSNKKEPNIIKTIVENGEQFVEIKSNWKFNPRKLTENQKEKLKRKRDDIPALYQDLSQSQDEFKLNAWKTDSQDTSNSTSSSRSNIKPTSNDVALKLKAIPGNEVVSSIIENITSDKKELDVEQTAADSLASHMPNSPLSKTVKRKVRGPANSGNSVKIIKTQAANETKSPRMALKDRVFKNVRNLIEKSNIQTERHIKPDEKLDGETERHIKPDEKLRIQLEPQIKPDEKDRNVIDVPKTPLTKSTSVACLVNSAPPKLSSERPSRLIKKPKKFDDSELLVIKKRRRSINDSQSNRELQDISLDISSSDVMERIKEANITNETKAANNNSCQLTNNFPLSDDAKSNHERMDVSCNSVQLTDNCNNKINNSEKISESSESNANSITANSGTTNSVSTIIKEVKVTVTDIINVTKEENDVIRCTGLTTSNIKKDKSNNMNTPIDDSKIAEIVSSEVSSVSKEKQENSNKNTKCRNDLGIKSCKVSVRKENFKLDTMPVATDLADEHIVLTDKSKTKTEIVNSKNLVEEEKEHEVSSVSKEKQENSNKNTKCRNDLGIKSCKVSVRKENFKLDTMPVATDLADEHIVLTDKSKTKTEIVNSKNLVEEEKEHHSSSIKLVYPCEKYSPVAASKKNILGSSKHETDRNNSCLTTDSKINTSLEAEKKEKVSSKQKTTQKDKTNSTSSDNSIEETSVKKKTSRIEKQLSIDMVEGHPFLQSPSDKRPTRKTVFTRVSEGRRKRTEVTQSTHPSKAKEVRVVRIVKIVKNSQDEDKSTESVKSDSVISDSENVNENSQDLPLSEDVIESSQDSTITAISVASTKHILNKKNVSDNSKKCSESSEPSEKTQELIDIIPFSDNSHIDLTVTEDIELSKNKTMPEQNESCSTECMDTEPVVDRDTSGEAQITKEVESPIVINTAQVGLDSQQVAEADTQPMDVDLQNEITLIKEKERDLVSDTNTTTNQKSFVMNDTVITVDNTQGNGSNAYSENLITLTDSNETCSPLKDNIKKKTDFLNDTLEISPIKTMSPIRDENSPSPDNSSDYVVIKLSSPVQSNGEPFEKDSPEVFTEDKMSPEKLDQSPPRVETIPSCNTSPSSSLSLKKNRPQVRSAGRAAQILGLLCASDKTKESEKTNDSEENKKNTVICTPARRNLKVIYNTVPNNNDNPSESEDSENFLKFKRAIPTPDCSPSGPILKRKLAEICDDSSSPASKRKRVSFHNPPVSTTVAVQKYIEPGAVRSPQNRALKRLERQIMTKANMKFSKKLDTVFKLETALTKTVESFSDEPTPLSSDTEMSSIEQTPIVEVIKTSDLNDTEPICKDLTECYDPIDNIASELSSPGMRDLFVKELKGKVDTIADLAKMTELEVNRLCIKVPKIKTAKKVLSDYCSRREIGQEDTVVQIGVANVSKLEVVSVEISTQTNSVTTQDIEMQTCEPVVTINSTQTESLPITHSSVQTNESGEMTTKSIVEKCLAERPDFFDVLIHQLPYSSIELLCNKLPTTTILEVLLRKMNASNSTDILNRIVAHRSSQDISSESTQSGETSFLKDFSKDLILLCSQLVQKIHDKPA